MTIKLVIDERYQDFLSSNYIEYNKINIDNIPNKNYITSRRDYIYWDDNLKSEITYSGKDIIEILTNYKPKKFYE